MKAEVFLDAAYAIALSTPRDSYHERAVLLADAMEAAQNLKSSRACIIAQTFSGGVPGSTVLLQP